MPPFEIAKLIDSAIRDELQASHGWYFVLLLVATFVVVAGVALEGPEVVNDLREAFSEYHPSPSKKKKAVALASLGWLLIAVGVAGEFLVEVQMSSLETRLQTFEDIVLTEERLELSVNEREVSAARRQAAAGFQTQIATANESAAKANERTAKAELQLEYTRAPRILKLPLGPNGVTGINGLKKWSGNPFSISAANNAEAIRLAEVIADILVQAGWKRLPAAPPGQTLINGAFSRQLGMIPMATGYGVQLYGGSDETWSFLLALISNSDIFVVGSPTVAQNGIQPMDIGVGEKPPFTFEEQQARRKAAEAQRAKEIAQMQRAARISRRKK